MSEEVDLLFQEAVESLRIGDRPRAKELLTRLLKVEQNNVNYWLWMSAAVETPKERVYCLETVLRIEPANSAARRGLVLLGAMPADDSIKPFQVSRPRAWEEELKLAHEKTKDKTPFMRTPAFRALGWGIAMLVAGFFIYSSLIAPNLIHEAAIPTFTHGPTLPLTLTPTSINATPQSTPTYLGPTPLWAQLFQTYTPTPFFISAINDPQLTEIIRAVRSAYQIGDWPAMIGYIQQGLVISPNSPDLWYMLGEAYRFNQQYAESLNAYNHALDLNPDFGPAYVGLARLRLTSNPDADPRPELDTAIERDPAYGEAYLLRAAYNTDHGNPDLALEDLRIAEPLLPNSALVQYEFARAYLALEDNANALASAKRANEIDITILPVYLVLGEAYAANGDYQNAANALRTYTTFVTDDPRAFFLSGKINYLAGNYEEALDWLNRSIDLENNPEARLYRGLTYVELGDGDNAAFELEHALDFYPNSFIAQIGLTRAYYLLEKFGSASIQADTAFALAETDNELAQVYYWRALSLEKQPGRIASAKRDWESLLALPPEAMPAEWRVTAQQHLAALTTPSVTPTPTKRGTATKTPTPSHTPTPTPK